MSGGPRPGLYDLNPIWGSHSAILEAEVARLDPGSLVIEHGLGLYSTSIISYYDVRVIAVEKEPGWLNWATWLYKRSGRSLEHVERAKNTLQRLADASLVFIDGEPLDRGRLLGWAIERNVPVIIAHDTEEDTLSWYRYAPHYFKASGYDVTHDGERPRTTVWRRRV